MTGLMFGYTWNRMVRFVDIKNDFVNIAGPTYIDLDRCLERLNITLKAPDGVR